MVYIWKKKKLLLFNSIKQQQDIDCNNFSTKKITDIRIILNSDYPEYIKYDQTG